MNGLVVNRLVGGAGSDSAWLEMAWISAEAGALSSAMTAVGPFALTARMTGAAALLGQNVGGGSVLTRRL